MKNFRLSVIVLLMSLVMAAIAYSQQAPAPTAPPAATGAEKSASQTPSPAGTPSTATAPTAPPAPTLGSYGTQSGQQEPSEESSRTSFFRWFGQDDLNLLGRSYVVPSFQFGSIYDSATVEGQVALSGNVILRRLGRNKELDLSYLGGGEIHQKLSEMDSSFHRLAIAQSFYTKRWTFNLSDDFSYLPQSPFGSSIYGEMGSSLVQFLNQFAPDQSILTVGGRRYSNSASVYVEREISRRSALHVMGAYSFLEFTHDGFVSYRSYSGNAGYSHNVGRRDSVSFDYTGGLTRYQSSRMQTHRFEVSYRHPLGRSGMLEFGAGPEGVYFSDDPSHFTATRVIADARASLTWKVKANYVALEYSHSAGGGSGLLDGADFHTADAKVNRTLLRVWNVGGGFGFSRNRAFSRPNLPLFQDTFDEMYVMGSVQRNVGRSLSVFLTYSFQNQLSGSLSELEPSFRRHAVMAGFNYNLRPIAIR